MKVESKRKCTLYCYVTGGVRHEDLKEDFLVEDGFIISRNDDDTVVTSLETGNHDCFCMKDYQKMRGCGIVFKVNTNGDTLDERGVAARKIINFLKILRVVQPNVANPHYFIIRYQDGDTMPHCTPDTLSTCYDLEENLFTKYEKAIQQKQIEKDELKYKKLFDKFVQLRKIFVNQLSTAKDLWNNLPLVFNNHHRVNMALSLHDTAYFERYREFRTLFFAMALESLFATVTNELTFSLALRTSRFIAKEFKERKRIFNNMCCAYVIRSKIVHGLVDKLKSPPLKHAEYTFRENLRKALHLIIQDRGLIKTFDNTGEHKKYMKHLVLADNKREVN